MAELPNIMTAAGLQPITLDQTRALLLDTIQQNSPEHVINAPAILLNAVADTSVPAIKECNDALVDAVNSITPYGLNEFALNQWGFLMGLTRNQFTRSSVYVLFTGTVGYHIQQGFIVGDGTHEYAVMDGGVIPSSGFIQLFCLATIDGSWAIPANTVNQLKTSVYGVIALSCNNPNDGALGQAPETLQAFRGRCITSLQRTATGTDKYARDLISRVAGVDSRLISVKNDSRVIKVIVGGSGDPLDISAAIYKSGLDISRLVGSHLDDTRNIVSNIISYPDTYRIIFVNPVAQLTRIVAKYNTGGTTVFVSDAAMTSLSSQALVDYISSLPVGFKINELELDRIFKESVKPIINGQFIVSLRFDVYVDDILKILDPNTSTYSSDTEGYFYTNLANVSAVRG